MSTNTNASTSSNSTTATGGRRPDNRITASRALKLLNGSGGRFVKISFVKDDGTDRVILCNVKKDQPNLDKGLLTVYSPADKGHRSVRIAGLKSILINGHEYRVRHNW